MKKNNRELLQRAGGIIEGLAYAVEDKQGEALINAVEMIDMVLEDEVNE